MARQRLPVLQDSDTKSKKSPKIRLPEWFRVTLPTGKSLNKFNKIKATITKNTLNTVCVEAKCPNIHECWSRGTATFMIAGQECTRGCRFCAVGSIKTPPPLDEEEPQNLALAVKNMKLEHAVITVVNRDDLDDSGATHYRRCIEKVRETCPETSLELLCSDLAGDKNSLSLLLKNLELEVFAHNVECVPRLDSKVRDVRASFNQSLNILRWVKELRPDIITKSSIMVGLGETDEEVVEAMKLLREVNCDIITIGQYLQPNKKLLPVDRFPTPEKFKEWDKIANEIGFLGSACGPLVRSSYRAGTLYRKITSN
jgi:lipoic acid synthetase